MKLSKKSLLSLINENLNEMAMDFDTADRPNPELQAKLASGDTPLKKIPFPKTGNEPNQNFQELLASERYRQIVNNVRQYTNYQGTLNGDMGSLTMMMYDAHNSIIRKEMAHKVELEQLAIQLVKEEMGIGDEIEFDAKIVGMNEIDTSDFNREQGPEQNPDEVDVEDDGEENNDDNQPEIAPEYQEVEEELYIDLKQLNLERAKLTLINSIIQGASKRGHYMYQLVGEKLRELTGSDELYNNYGIMMSVNDANYWQFSPSMIKGSSDSVAGKVKTEFPGNDETGETGDEGGEEGGEQEEQKVKVVARGINFPVLIHELIKGVFEILGSHGQPGEYSNPQDREMYQQAQKLESTLEKEMWTLILGPAIWDRIRGQFPDEVILENGKQLQNYMLMHIFQLPAKQFLVLMKEVVSNSENGKRLMTELMASIQQMFNNQDYEESMNQFNDELDTMSDEMDSDDLRDFISGIPGISLSSDEGDDDDLDDLYRQLGLDRPKE